MNSAVAVGDLTDISEYDSNALYIVLYDNGYVICALGLQCPFIM